MNATLFVSALRQRFTSIPRLALLFCVFTFPLLMVALARGIGTQPLGTGGIFAFILGAGILGQETSSGVMQLLFARPVRRVEYVLSRWLAVVSGAAFLSLLQLAFAWLIWLGSGMRPEGSEIAAHAAQQAINAAGTASVILLFSSFVSGIGDVVAVVLTQITGQILVMAGQFKQWGWLVRTGEEVLRFINATFPVGPIVAAGDWPWFELVSYASTVALCLAVAVWTLNRREISYASE